MTKLDRCDHCRGFLPRNTSTCPHCGRRGVARRLLALGGAVGGGAIAFTLMACYGMPPCPDGTRDCHRPVPAPNASDAGDPAEPTAVDVAPDGGE